jgi:hypothetical protein
MNPHLLAFVWTILIVALLLPVGVLLERWFVRQLEQRVAARIATGRDDRTPLQAKRQPESGYVVSISEAEVVCNRPDGKTERVAWNDLQRVEIVTTDQGPFVPDVFWVLHGTESGCVVPQGATGDMELLVRLQKLPGFDNIAVIEAGPSAGNKRFLCWQRGGVKQTGEFEQQES